MKIFSAHIKLTVLIITIIVLSGCASLNQGHQEVAASQEYTFVVASDPQPPWGAIENWQQTINEINKISPDFVIVCGDMTNDSRNEKEISAYFETAKELSPGIRLFHVPGNHDLLPEPSLASLELYKKHFGKPYYSFEHKKSLFIVLESSSFKSTATAATPLVAEQMRWLRQTLIDSDKKQFDHKFVFLHHPFVLEKINEEEEYFNLPVALRNELLEIFVSHNVEIVFSGHLHQNRAIKIENIELVVNGSCGKALADSDLGFRIVKVSAQGVEHSFYKLSDQSLR